MSLKYFPIIIKQLLNSVLAGYEELLKPRFVLSASAFGFGTTQTSVLIIFHILLNFIQ